MKRLRTRVAQGLAPEAFVRAAPFVFGPYVPFPVAFRVMGPNIGKVRPIANEVESIMRANPNMRQVNQGWGTRVPKVHFVLDQDRLRLIGLSSNDAAQQLQFLLTGAPVTTGVRVPAIIVSPFVAAGSCFSQPLDHTSILKMLADKYTPATPYSADVVARTKIHNAQKALTLTTGKAGRSSVAATAAATADGRRGSADPSARDAGAQCDRLSQCDRRAAPARPAGRGAQVPGLEGLLPSARALLREPLGK